MFIKTNFSGNSKNWGDKKILGALPPNAPVTTGLICNMHQTIEVSR